MSSVCFQIYAKISSKDAHEADDICAVVFYAKEANKVFEEIVENVEC